MAHFYTLADLVRVTGAKRRSLQLWADAGVIKAKKGTNRAGTGTHRLFSRDEAIVSCIVHAFALRQIAIGELLHISSAVRYGMQGSIRNLFIDRAISGEGDPLLIFESWRSEELGGMQYGISFYKDDKGNTLENNGAFVHLWRPEAFAGVIKLRTYLSKIDS